VIQDMVSPKPMDRLVCGDVGFGKTEVALRAAFVAVHGGKQVAILARPRCWPSSTTRRWSTASASGR
jgi:transcription-repair coupling factor (superfamily II helicase)